MSKPVLPIRWISQLGPGANANGNDCGAATGLMVLQAYRPDSAMSVDDFYRLAHPVGANAPLYLGEIAAALSGREVPIGIKYGLKVTDLYDFLRRRRPVIALIHYGTLVQASLTQYTNFGGAHFVTAVGMDIDCVYIHDPYTIGLFGAGLAVPVGLFETAWTVDPSKDGNPLGAGIIPLHGIGEIPPVVPPNALYSVKIICSAQNVRSGPGMNHPTVTAVYKGTILPVYETSGEWGRVGDGRWLWLGKPLNDRVPE